jgi:hypothetical protein
MGIAIAALMAAGYGWSANVTHLLNEAPHGVEGAIRLLGIPVFFLGAIVGYL